MIWTVTARELLLLLRSPGFRAVPIGYLLVFTTDYLTSYLEFTTLEGVIPDEMRQAFGRRVLNSQVILLSLLTPWVVSRAMLSHKNHAMIQVIALTALAPWRLMCGKLLAISMYLCQLLFLSLPAMILTHLLGSITVNDLVGSYIALVVWLTLLQLSASCWSILIVAALPSLILAYVTLCILSTGYWYVATLTGDLTRIVATTGINVCLGLFILRYCNRHLMYLRT